MIDIYLSCRRVGGYKYAQRIKNSLMEHGYSVFYDEFSTDDSKYDKSACRFINQAKLFIPIIFEGAMDGCIDKNDKIRGEIDYALSIDMPFLVTTINFMSESMGFPQSLIGDNKIGSKVIAKGSRCLNIDYFYDMNIVNYITNGVAKALADIPPRANPTTNIASNENKTGAGYKSKLASKIEEMRKNLDIE